MCFVRISFAMFSTCVLACLPAAASHLVTGNGHGFAVVSPETATVTKFYAHPYSFVRPDPTNSLSEGVETTNFIKVLSWGEGGARGASAEYDDDSHVIHTRSGDGNGFFFMPFGLGYAALIISSQPGVENDRGRGLSVKWSHTVRSQRTVRMSGVAMQLLKFDDVKESLLLIPLDGGRNHSAMPREQLGASPSWAMVALESDDQIRQTVREFNRWRAGLAPQALAKREIGEVERWRVRPAVQFASETERHLWRQSEVLLRVAQSREPNRAGRNNYGLIVASLPDGVWFMPWVRDMAYATAALAQMGHRDEARAALLAYFNAQPTGKMRSETRGANYQISVVRYFGDGSEEPFFTMEGSTNIEFDNWGLVLWVLGDYLRKYDDSALLQVPTYRGRLYESARDYIAKPLLANLEKYGEGLIVAADTSIWEERQRDKKHFAFSTAAAIVGLRNFAEVARRAGDEPARAEMLKSVALLEKGFDAAFIRGGKLRGTLEEGVKNDIDGALLAVINFGIVKNDAVVRDAVERMELLKVRSGGYRRVRGTYTDPAIFEYWYEKQEFVFVDISLAEVYRRLGRYDEAAAMLERIIDKSAADHDVISEMYVAESCSLFPGEVGDPTGAMPMVGYGAGAYIMHLLQRGGLEGKP